MKITATGSSVLQPSRNGDEIPAHYVQLLPDLSANLPSLNQIVKKGHTVIFNNDGYKVIDLDGDVITTGSNRNDLVKLVQRKQDKSTVLAGSSAGSLEV